MDALVALLILVF
jgi:predicted unusual protein kinase regulating ubiquinone biosynthesis (AarF/ABC1/UbiB family)